MFWVDTLNCELLASPVRAVIPRKKERGVGGVVGGGILIEPEANSQQPACMGVYN